MSELTFELAAELKANGWPQPDVDDLGPGDGCYVVAGGKLVPPALTSLPIAYSPLLGELVRAVSREIKVDVCRYEFTLVAELDDGEWCARYQWFECLEHDFRGKTPEEAVARLWLSLPPELRVK
jgi:hypothetical protein